MWRNPVAAILAALACFCAPGAVAQTASSPETVDVWVEKWDPETGRWIKVEASEREGNDSPDYDLRPQRHDDRLRGNAEHPSSSRFENAGWSRQKDRHGPARGQDAVRYGPFLVTGPRSALLDGTTDRRSLAHFDAMMREFPQLEVIRMIDAPGTVNDVANLELGRRIRRAGLKTTVPPGGSVRSGAIELFLAGQPRSISPDTRFAVHAWRDAAGRRPSDYGPGSRVHRMYIDYYKDMGMSEKRARNFYAMTNSVPHRSPRWLNGSEMRSWIRRPEQTSAAAPMRRERGGS
ncbi:hypothetical protein [Erythrobacter sp.]|uniref:hypothetical protein n=1 Tax=Erythrobacter sp. TaxID=1042 RepID=UPI001425D11E|nr:hypothetical protein [Erythrobacter sp.]QIQ85576.1 MAG: hypothetical protein G9473_01925 [Erythrobacter sp.]